VGLVRELKAKSFHKRPTDYIRYNGTKHDRSRRYFGSPNPISYFYVANFIADHWKIFESRFGGTPFSVSQPKIARDTDDRPIIIPSLSELTTIASKKLRYSAYVLRADIAQFFPSIYTHAISWSAHGVAAAKADIDPRSGSLVFNQLDFFVRNCQRGETRGIIVGPDAFRLIAEYIACGLDDELNSRLLKNIIGAARHVDDYYIGLNRESDAQIALSALRDTLQRYNLNINDAKTKIMTGVEPLNELWAQDLRDAARGLNKGYYSSKSEEDVLFFTKAVSLSRDLGSDSPLKIALRAMDQIRIYAGPAWETIEPYLQRVVYHHPHCIDYVALLTVKRVALGESIDRDGWRQASYDLLQRHLSLNHHHEVLWFIWLLLSIGAELTEQIVNAFVANDNAHIRALVVAAYTNGRIAKKPSIRLGSKLATDDSNWLLNLVAKTSGYTGANFSGSLSEEFAHLAEKRVKFIDFKAHIKAIRKQKAYAISRTRYGYDHHDFEEDEDDDLDGYGGFDDDLE
jgi:hypothetical protein